MRILRIDLHRDEWDPPMEWLMELLKLDPNDYLEEWRPGCSDSDAQHLSLCRKDGCR